MSHIRFCRLPKCSTHCAFKLVGRIHQSKPPQSKKAVAPIFQSGQERSQICCSAQERRESTNHHSCLMPQKRFSLTKLDVSTARHFVAFRVAGRPKQKGSTSGSSGSSGHQRRQVRSERLDSSKRLQDSQQQGLPED